MRTGERLTAFRDNLQEKAGKGFNTARNVGTAASGYIGRNRLTIAIYASTIGLSWGFLYYDSTYVRPERLTQANATQAAEKKAREETDAAIRRDFEETGGVNVAAYNPNVYILTLRDSARLGDSREAVLGRALARVAFNTGCSIGSVAYLPANPSGDPSSHEAYLATTTC